MAITGDFPPLLPRSSRTLWLALIAAIGVGMSMIAGALFMHPHHGVAGAMPATSIAARGSPESPASPARTQLIALTPEPPVDDRARPLRITITSDPPRAHIRGSDGDHVLEGTAPLSFETRRDAPPYTVTLTLPGRTLITRTIAPTRDTEILVVVPGERNRRVRRITRRNDELLRPE